MPPLQAPPDDDWDAVDAAEPPNGRGRWAWLAVAVLLVLGLAGGAWYLLSDGHRGADGATAATSTTQTSASPTGIQLDPAAFIGHPADDVEATLKAAGLTVTQRAADDAELAGAGTALDAGDVAGLRPSGVLATPGTQVVLFVARTAYDPSHRSSATPTTTAAKTTSAPPTTTAPPKTTTPTSTSTSTSSSIASGTQEPTDPVVPPAGGPDGAPGPSGAG
jgi:serine/threonine-protein kinase